MSSNKAPANIGQRFRNKSTDGFVRSAAIILLLMYLAGLALPAQVATETMPDLTLLGPTVAASSGGQAVAALSLQGTATLHSGSLVDTGDLTLSVDPTGKAAMQFVGHGKAARTEWQDSVSVAMQCTWAGADGISHSISADNCRRPFVWFLPAYSIQLLSKFPNASVTNLQAGTVASASGRDIHVSWNLPGEKSAPQWRAIDLLLDPSTSLPIAMRYRLVADKHTDLQTIEVRYSEYHVVNGFQVAYAIQRYVNGSLQFDIHLTGPASVQ